MKSIALIDLCAWDGHHRSYFLEVCRVLEELGAQVHCLCLDPEDFRLAYQELNGSEATVIPDRQAPNWVWWLSETANKIWHRITGSVAISTPYHIENLFRVRRSLRAAELDRDTLVFFLHLDSMLLIEPAWLGRILMPDRWVGLYIFAAHRTPETDPNRAVWETRERIFTSEKCQGVYVLDEGAVDAVASKVTAGFVEFLPELINIEVNPQFDLPEVFHSCLKKSQKIIGFYGPLNRRKNLLQFLRCVACMEPGEVQAVVMGKLDLVDYTDDEQNEVEGLLADTSRVWAEFGMIPEIGFDALVASSDAIWVAYRNFVGSSNILAKAAALRRPVIASQGYVMGERVERYGLGITIDADNIEEGAQAIRAVCRGERMTENRTQEFLDLNSSRVFREKLGLVVRS